MYFISMFREGSKNEKRSHITVFAFTKTLDVFQYAIYFEVIDVMHYLHLLEKYWYHINFYFKHRTCNWQPNGSNFIALGLPFGQRSIQRA